MDVDFVHFPCNLGISYMDALSRGPVRSILFELIDIWRWHQIVMDVFKTTSKFEPR